MSIRKYWAPLAGLCLFATVTVAVATVAFVLRAGSLVQAQLVSAAEFKEQTFALTSEVFDRRGEKIGEFAAEQRYYVTVKELPAPVIQAFVSAEDKSFYRHHGINPWSTMRAVWANLKGGGLKQGASTITQQLARLLFLDQSKTLERKIKEALLAVALERRLSKDEILELYLNKIYLGNHSYGVEAAARNYFRKQANQLTIAESAVLAGLAKSPNAYAPHRHPSAASQRQRVVLQRMEEDGFLAPGEAATWAKQPLTVADGPEGYSEGAAAYVVQAVRAEIGRKLEYKQLPHRGLRIYTTIDASLQRAAARHLRESLRVSRRTNRHPDGIEGALVSLEPSSGAILAMQGGADFARSQFDRTTATKRPLGALFLPFYIGLALEHGYTMISRIGDDPLGGHQMLQSSGAPSLYEVLRDGDVVAAAPLYAALGHGSVQDFVRRLGLVFEHQDLTQAYGSGAASPLQVAVAYAAFSNGGRLVVPHLIERIVTANDVTIYQEKSVPSSIQVVNPQAAYIVHEVLHDAIAYGHAAKARGVSASAAGIGAMTQDRHDAWFVGSLPNLVSVLWNGAENGRARLDRDQAQVVGGLAAAWAAYMRAAPKAYLQSAERQMPPDGISYAKRPAAVPKGAPSLPFLSGSEPKQAQRRLF